jgi:hypothetical protein
MRLERFLSDAAARTDEYFTLFQDLTAEETKTIELYRGPGELSRTRRIVSDLVVYQAQIDNASIAEYRDVREVDGAPVPGREGRLEKMIAARSGSASIRDELERITRESTRYDLDKTVSGLVISEGLPLQAWARALFAFTIVGTERVEGRPTVVLDYRQTVPNPRFGFKFSLPSELGDAQPLYRGRLWIDAETARLWRERREIAVSSPAAPTPLVIQSIDFLYKPSRFDVPLPSRIVYASSLKFDKGPDRILRAVPVFRVTFEYGPFKRFTTSANESELAAAPDARDEPGTVPLSAPEPDVDLGPEFAPGAPESGLTYEQLRAAPAAPAAPAAEAKPAPPPSTPRRPEIASTVTPPVARPITPPSEPAAKPSTPPPAPPPRSPAPTPPAPRPSRTTVPVPAKVPVETSAPPPAIRTTPGRPPGPVAEPPRPRPAVRLPRAIAGIFQVRTAVSVPAAVSSPPSYEPADEALGPPPTPPDPVAQPRKAWRPPPS